MRKLFASLLTSLAFAPIFWTTVVPTGAEDCNTPGYRFAFHPQDELGEAAGANATLQFCNLVKNNPA